MPVTSADVGYFDGWDDVIGRVELSTELGSESLTGLAQLSRTRSPIRTGVPR